MSSLKKLRDSMQQLEKIHQIYILNLLKINSVPYTENSNGIFVNMSSISKPVIKDIREYLKYVELQETQLEDAEVTKAEYKKSLFKDNKEILT
jgi:hypothetical protein